MEFMDRRQRSLLVQFWLTVESFKNPLESVDSDGSDDEDEPLLDPGQSATLKDDISLINELYFSSPVTDPLLSAVSQKHVNTIRSFGQSAETSTPASERRVRKSVMLAQRQMERQMEQDFEDFQRSELWFRVVADIEANGRAAPTHDSALIAGNRSPTSSRQPSDSKARAATNPLSGHAKPSIFRTESTPVIGASSRQVTIAPNSPVPVMTPPSRPSVSNLQVLMSPIHEHDTASALTPRAPLFDDPEDAEQQEQSQRMDAIQAALTDIIALDKQHDQAHPGGAGSSSDSLSIQDSVMTSSTRLTRDKRRLVFDDEIGEEEANESGHHARDGAEDAEHDKEHGSFQLAGPGDLQLSHEIERLTNKINKLQTQDAMLDTLIKKAELTGDAQELRLLRRSKSSLTRELRELKFQKTQYEQQENANRLLSDRTKVAIVNSTVGEEDGKQVVRYLVEVQQLAHDGSFSSGWVVARRYNEFFNMHNKLKDKYLLVRSLDFPGKRLVTSLSGSFVDSRRIGLEKYLQVRYMSLSGVICEVSTNTLAELDYAPRCLRKRGVARFSLSRVAFHGCRTFDPFFSEDACIWLCVPRARSGQDHVPVRCREYRRHVLRPFHARCYHSAAHHPGGRVRRNYWDSDSRRRPRRTGTEGIGQVDVRRCPHASVWGLEAAGGRDEHVHVFVPDLRLDPCRV